MKNGLPQTLGVIVLLVRNNQILLGRRKNAYGDGKYGSPGGRIELHEDLESCAKRELHEETGVTAQKMQYVGFVKDAQQNNQFDFIHFVFACEDWSGKPGCKEPDKCEGWEWFNLQKLPKETLGALRAAVALYIDTKSSGSRTAYVEIQTAE